MIAGMATRGPRSVGVRSSTSRPLCPRLCCKSHFGRLFAKFSSYRCVFHVGDHITGDELSSDFGNELEAISVSDFGLFHLLAGN